MCESGVSETGLGKRFESSHGTTKAMGLNGSTKEGSAVRREERSKN